jgi:hypothetical protein
MCILEHTFPPGGISADVMLERTGKKIYGKGNEKKGKIRKGKENRENSTGKLEIKGYKIKL